MTPIPLLRKQELDYENPYQKIFKISADFGAFTKEYFVNDHGEKAGVLMMQGEQTLLVGQYRLLVNQLSWEVPGGKVDENETPEKAAIREALEETGLECRNLKPLLMYQVGMDTVRTPTSVFYTDDFQKKDDFTPCVKEIEEMKWVPISKCVEMIFKGIIVDSFSIIAILSYQIIKGSRLADDLC